ncbi:MAG: 4-hydroxythreonine-4-phosphate dehydrogenase PdxA [Candidatus Margulisiibacteriota bacterium]
MRLPIIGITIGDPAGIGPEIIEKALKSSEVTNICNPEIIADDEYYQNKNKIVIGKVQPLGGKIAVESFLLAIRMAQSGELDAIVTTPLNKAAIHMAGYSYNGHTEILAELTGTQKYAMLFYSEPLKVILTTIHCSLASVPKLLTAEKLQTTIELGYQAMLDLGINQPRLGVAGLNPHAGEGGLFGNEEQEIILPVIKDFQKRGWQIQGPLPPDTIFRAAVENKYDLIIAQYHDQGLIPLKLLAFDKAVNITVGTPVIRTSVDHGTAFDIAGTDIANPSSLIEAIKVAVRLVNNKQRRSQVIS